MAGGSGVDLCPEVGCRQNCGIRGQSTEPPSMVLRRKGYENENRGLAGTYCLR